jgi:hypothetical protein
VSEQTTNILVVFSNDQSARESDEEEHLGVDTVWLKNPGQQREQCDRED